MSTPPPIVKKFDYHTVKQINLNGKRLYEAPDGSKTPSVTTVLSATKDMTGLNAWKKRIGKDKAQQIVTEAAGVGTAMHANLERFLLGEKRQPGNNTVHVKANAMAQQIIDKGLTNVDEVWGIEQALYFPKLYSGTTDLVGVYKGEPAIMDFKQSNKPKKLEYVDDYFMQLTAYRLAHNEVYGTDIKRGVIFVCTRDEMYQQFDLDESNYKHWESAWWDKLEQYYEKTSA